ncbi:TIGR02444 family protein [Photobacterium atrarenae]|uniref:TIGR02444 family protein n=1 Tax=Photobacterium atrarenae TaxID=865757 RepID=A0ABY5GFK5_9GAMM|nr:TIGR02444 family protein [Photobacterium atrarenae]UTV27977.1 TIGR02444 family protein [Photobacterium atrarenae]
MADAKSHTQPQAQPHDQTRPDPAGFWPFCLAHYVRPGVEPACLTLQERYRGNVNLALLLHWLDTQAQALPEHGQDQLCQALSETESLLTPYRAMRRALKPQLDRPGYQQLLDFELTLEKRQQQALLDQLAQLPLRREASASNLQQYARTLAVPLDLLRRLQGYDAI